MWDPRKQRLTHCNLPLLLPHDIIYNMLKHGASLEALLSKEGFTIEAAEHLAHARQELQCHQLLGLGLWMDGVPCNWDRSQSVETVCISFPGLEGQWNNLRVPLVSINKKFVVKQQTFDDIFEILAWSFTCLSTGSMPTCRHDATPWTQLDSSRKIAAGQAIGCQGVLAEVRGDWACFKDTFRFPGWNTNAGCCWRCTATPQEVRQCGLEAPWRQPSERLGHWGLMQRILESGQSISPLFACPCIKTSCFTIDWLHVADLGVAPDFLGNIFMMLLPKLAGTSQKERVQALFLCMKDFYRRHPSESQLDDLTLLMIRKAPNTTPKLRARGAEARGLIPFAEEMANRFLSEDIPAEATARECAKLLNSCYSCLSRSTFDASILQESCRRFCLLYVALEQVHSGKAWRCKPKFHLFQELCEFTKSSPATCWNYRDEDFGGTVAKLGHKRGGKNSPEANSRIVLTRFMAKHELPLIR